MAGDKAAAKIVANELAARRKMGPMQLSPAELAQAEAEDEQRRALGARLVQLLEDKAAAKRESVARMVYHVGQLVPIDPQEGDPSREGSTTREMGGAPCRERGCQYG